MSTNERVEISKSSAPPVSFSADSSAMEKINLHTLRELCEADVFAFKVTACDNEIDRDFEAFTADCLKQLGELYIGKTVIFDHSAKAASQCARVFDSAVVSEERKSSTGEKYHRLVLSCYIPRGLSESDELIARIETGMLKEVSVHLVVGLATCSICKKNFLSVDCAHQKGEKYDNSTCYSILGEPVDVYELSFVPIPAQPAAGVTKGVKTLPTLEQAEPQSFVQPTEKPKGDYTTMTKSNRWQLETMRSGIAAELENATSTLNGMYSDAKSKVEDRESQKSAVADIKERLVGVTSQIETIDKEAATRLEKQAKQGANTDTATAKKAEFVRNVMAGAASAKGLTDTAASGGGKLIPTTLLSELVTEPLAKNPLRGLSRLTTIPNLEVPKISFTLEDDSFIEDGATAKEMKASPGVIQFGRKKLKVFAEVSETILGATDTALVSEVENSLQSGLAKKEKKVAFAETPNTGEEHMSFYAKKADGSYEIAETSCLTSASLYDTIQAAIADLEEDYRDRATILMRYADYLSMISTLSNNSVTLYGVPPEQILGKPVRFCDSAVVPIVGDFSYSHFNYDLETKYERDKNIKSGMECFVLTAYFDHRIKMYSAFRLATRVKTVKAKAAI